LEADAAAGGHWIGDPDRLRQIAVNLISNAIKFTDTGEVRVRILAGAPEGLRIEVHDTGVGVPADKLDVIFDKFSQAECSTTRRFGGSGLGLAISRQLAQMMGGRLWVESQPGQGSVFGFEAPLTRVAEPAIEAAPADEPAAEPAGHLRVLAVDDNATNRFVLAAILEEFEVDLDLREDGVAAVEAWRAAPYDLILMDIQMPELDGVAATRMIREEEAKTGRARTPIIAVTANAMTHQLAEYSCAGMDDCVPKPIRIPDLHAAMLRAFALGSESAAHAGGQLASAV
jgi:CheY-like chemotaxis protein